VGCGAAQLQRAEESHAVGRAVSAVAVFAFLLSGCFQAKPKCPAPPKQSDVLRADLLRLPVVSPSDNVRKAIDMIIKCRPPHPIFGGPAVVAYADTYAKKDDTFYVRFTVKSLSDISLIYEVSGQGHVIGSYVYGT
jgi:hypothetical protein